MVKVKIEKGTETVENICSSLKDCDYNIELIQYEDGNLVILTGYQSYVNDFPNYIGKVVADNINSKWGLRFISDERVDNKKVLEFTDEPTKEEVFKLYAIACDIDVLVASQISEQGKELAYEDICDSIYEVSGGSRFETIQELREYMHISKDSDNSYSAFDI